MWSLYLAGLWAMFWLMVAIRLWKEDEPLWVKALRPLFYAVIWPMTLAIILYAMYEVFILGERGE